MNNIEIWQDATAINTTLAEMSLGLGALLIKRGIDHPFMVGIHTGGIWVAQHLHQRLAIKAPLGMLDIAFYRDDFTRIGLHPLVRPTILPEEVENRHIVLVDDILHTGRTIRAALNALFDYGRPASVILAVLAVRNGHELPIKPDITGLNVEESIGKYLKLEGPEPLRLVFAQTRCRTDNGSVDNSHE